MVRNPCRRAAEGEPAYLTEYLPGCEPDPRDPDKKGRKRYVGKTMLQPPETVPNGHTALPAAMPARKVKVSR